MSRCRVLIVDDDPASHEVLGHYLAMAGYVVDYASNGAEGLAAIDAARPDLVLLDVQMPILDGFRTMEAIRARPELADLPIVFLTSLAQGHLRVKGLELGAEDYVTKPYAKAELLARVRAALRRSRRYREDGSAMRGQLSHVSLTELLQTLEIGRRTARVRLPDVDGELLVSGGRLAYARQGRFEREGALARLLLLERGRFSVDFEEPAGAHGERPALQPAIMDALTCVDHVRARLRTVGVDATLVDLAPEARADARWAPYAELAPLPLRDLVALLPGALLENAALVADAHATGRLRVVR